MSYDRAKSPSVTAAEIPQSMLAQAAAAAEGDAEDDDDNNNNNSSNRTHQNTLDFLTSQPTESDEVVPPPAYGESYGDIASRQQGVDTKASLTSDGRVDININQTSNTLSRLLVPALRSQLDIVDTSEVPPPYIPASLGGADGEPPPPPLNVVIHVVGSRGDVQPFVALGRVLKDTYGHRVRLATHPVFRDFVTENGLEFFSIGGDPAELMAFMVRNPGLMPGFDVLRSGDVGKRRAEISTMIKGCWRSCIESGDGSGVAANENTAEPWMDNVKTSEKPFICDAIIANPPSFAHIHCAEKLGCPLHMMFTMPYSATQAFPHPLANIQSTNADPNLTNYISYTLVEMLTWQGLGDIINRFRSKMLGLDPISPIWAPGLLSRLRIPYTYCWSPALIPKPKDWGKHITISGFYFLSLASNFTPAADLKAFLDAGPPPVYIGFGSIVVDDPNAMTTLIFEAVKKTGQRALVSKGWGGFGSDQLDVPESVFMLGNVPHDWLFKHVSCVVHHGGAGTTAAGIACGRPTVVVPFFGDQPFWGAMVAKAGAGPDPINHKELTADKLAAAINKALEPSSLERAQELAESISSEKGTDNGAQRFHQFLEVDKLRCTIAPSRAAVWRLKRTDVTFSAFAATTLAAEGLLDFRELKLHRPRDYEADDGPLDPFSGGAGALAGTISAIMMGVADFPVAALKALNIHPDATANKNKKASTQGASTPSTSDQQRNPSVVPTPSGTASPAPGGSFNLDESLARMGSPHMTPTEETGKRGRSSSMVSALRGQLENVRNRSGSRGSPSSRNATPQKSQTQDMQGLVDTAFGTGKGVSRIVGAGFRSPLDMTQALAKGFHNAPKLYGDDSVRKADKVTDFRSGLRAATKEFGYGMYDGITGLVTQPMNGAKKEGAAGFIKGIGKGIGGIMLKPSAAICGIPAYTMEGMWKELSQRSGSSVQNYIIAARTAQGYDEWHRSSPGERSDVVRRWKIIQSDLKRKKNPHEHLAEWLGRRQWTCATQDDKPAQPSPGTSGGQATRSTAHHASGSGSAAPAAIHVAQPPLYQDLNFTTPSGQPTEMEEAIRTSVANTSRGDPDQDAIIERAIRASIAELSSRPPPQSAEEEDEALQKAMAASLAEAQRQHGGGQETDEELERALKASLEHREPEGKRPKHDSASDNEWDTSSSEGDEDIRTALKASEEQARSDKPAGTDHDEDLQRAISQSQDAHKDRSKEEEEERIVLEYVKKQSLMEEEHRQRLSKGKGKEEVHGRRGGGNEDEDAELKRAMELSLKKEGAEGERS